MEQGSNVFPFLWQANRLPGPVSPRKAGPTAKGSGGIRNQTPIAWRRYAPHCRPVAAPRGGRPEAPADAVLKYMEATYLSSRMQCRSPGTEQTDWPGLKHGGLSVLAFGQEEDGWRKAENGRDLKKEVFLNFYGISVRIGLFTCNRTFRLL